MLIHVAVRYKSETSPVENPEGVRALVDFAEWMETQAEFPEIRPIAIYWSAEKPPAAFAVMEAPGPNELRTFLDRLPTPISLELQPVRPLAEAVADGRVRLAEWEALAR